MNILLRLGHAVDYYESLGFKFIGNAPWLVTKQVFEDTAPPDANPFITDRGEVLVGSAEQSFLQMVYDGNLPPGRYCAFSPCFRREEEDNLHQQQFYKIELFQTGFVSDYDLGNLIQAAYDYFSQFISCDLIETEQGWDLVGKLSRVEIGSYGKRYAGSSGVGVQWIMGTGLALPRLDKVIEIEREYVGLC